MSARRRAACSTTRRRCSTGSSTERWFRASAVVGFWPANSDGDDILVYGDETRGQSRSPCCTRCASSSRGAKAAPTWRSPISSRRARAARRLHRRLHGHRRHRRGRGRRALQARQRRLFGDHGQGAGGSAGGSLRRAPAPARAQGVLGATRRTKTLAQRGPDRAKNIAASARRPAIPRSPTTPRRRRCSRCSTASGASGSSSPRALRCGRARRCAGSISAIPRATISASARSSATRSRTMPRRKGWSVAEAERWLAPILNYDPLACRAHRGGVAATGFRLALRRRACGPAHCAASKRRSD